MKNIYDATNKFFVYSNFSSGTELVPVSFIDELLERNIFPHTLEDMMFYRTITKNATEVVHTTFGELVGQDLTGKDCYTYFRNYEDSEWLYANTAVTITTDADTQGKFYSFSKLPFGSDPADFEDYAEEMDEATFYNPIYDYNFYAADEVIVVTK